jgi:hypothetical protein
MDWRIHCLFYLNFIFITLIFRFVILQNCMELNRQKRQWTFTYSSYHMNIDLYAERQPPAPVLGFPVRLRPTVNERLQPRMAKQSNLHAVI